MAHLTVSLMERLRAETSEHHKRAESKPLERALVKGAISRATYVEYLSQRLHIHESLDLAVRNLCATDSRLGDLIADDLYQLPRLRADLNCVAFGNGVASPRPAVLRLIDDIESARKACATAVLGAYYVFEGSKNGARFISRAVRPALGLLGPDGWSYLDPHGGQQPLLWASFKARMDAVAFSKPEMDSIVTLAAKTFDRVAELDDEMWIDCDGAQIAKSASGSGQ